MSITLQRFPAFLTRDVSPGSFPEKLRTASELRFGRLINLPEKRGWQGYVNRNSSHVLILKKSLYKLCMNVKGFMGFDGVRQILVNRDAAA